VRAQCEAWGVGRERWLRRSAEDRPPLSLQAQGFDRNHMPD
jgi:hypothetical protein